MCSVHLPQMAPQSPAGLLAGGLSEARVRNGGLLSLLALADSGRCWWDGTGRRVSSAWHSVHTLRNMDAQGTPDYIRSQEFSAQSQLASPSWMATGDLSVHSGQPGGPCCQMSCRLPTPHPEKLRAMCKHKEVTEYSSHKLVGKVTSWVSSGFFLDSSPQRPCSLPKQTAGPALSRDLEFSEWGSATALDVDVCMVIPDVKAPIHTVHIVP